MSDDRFRHLSGSARRWVDFDEFVGDDADVVADADDVADVADAHDLTDVTDAHGAPDEDSRVRTLSSGVLAAVAAWQGQRSRLA